MKVSILLPTCGTRLELLDNMLKSLDATAARIMYEIVAVIDESYEAAHLCVSRGVDVVDFSEKRRGALWAWNRALRLSSGDMICPSGDDQVFHEDWLGYALESHKERLGDYGVVGMNDLAYDGNLQVATMFMFDRLYCKEVMGGVFAPPMLKYYCVDLWWNEKAKLHGRFFWDSRSKVEHVHSAHNKRPVDSLDLEKQQFLEHDTKVFNERKSQGFPADYPSII